MTSILLSLIDHPISSREQLNQANIERMAATLRAGGSLPPIKLMKVGERYQPVYGEHRLDAHRLAGRDSIEAVVIDKPLTPGQIAREQFAENNNRTANNPREQASQFLAMVAEFGWDQETLATELGISPSKVAKTLKISKHLAADLQDAVAAGELGVSEAYQLSALPSHDDQRKLATRCMAGTLSRDGLTREIKKLLGQRVRMASPIRVTMPNGTVVIFPGDISDDAVDEDLSAAKKRVRKGRKLRDDDDPPVLLPV